MKPPVMRPWNLALRLGLEIAAVGGLGIGAWIQTDGTARWMAVVIAPLIGAALWGTFNVLDDPSRSDEAPVEVPGWCRLLIEVLVLGAGWTAYRIAGYPSIAVGFTALTVLHYAIAHARVRWLLNQHTSTPPPGQVRGHTKASPPTP